MRANAETLLTVMQAFIYDPLCEFGEGRAQQNKTGVSLFSIFLENERNRTSQFAVSRSL